MDETKTCSRCGVERPLTEFHSSGPNRTRKNICKFCCADDHRKRVEASPERLRAQWRAATRTYQPKASHRKRLRKYNLTQEEFETFVSVNDGACQICGDTNDVMAIDHCHKTGILRGYLCLRCNTGLGMFGDSLVLLQKASEYLAKFDVE